jgi:nucleotide-binding universal stress UspA family protein
MSIKKAIVPIDGSEVALKAAKLTAQFAQKEDWEVLLLHSVDLPHLAELVENMEIREQTIEGLREFGEDALAEAREVFETSNIPVSVKMVEGPAADMILSEAKSGCCGIVVMGSIGLGRGKLESLLFGSVAEHVIRKITIPILLVKEDTILD